MKNRELESRCLVIAKEIKSSGLSGFRIQILFLVNGDSMEAAKNRIMDEFEDDVVPSFEGRGIEIDTIEEFGGFTYESKEIQ